VLRGRYSVWDPCQQSKKSAAVIFRVANLELAQPQLPGGEYLVEGSCGTNEAGWAPRVDTLGVSRFSLSVMLDMSLGCFRGVVDCVLVVAVG